MDFPCDIVNITESLDVDTPLVPSCSMAGFTLHRVKMGKQHVLVKVFGNVVQGSLSGSESKAITEELLRELGFWKRHFYTNHFVHIMGYSEYIDSILPSPVYKQTVMAKEYVKETKNIPFLPFVRHILEGVAILHKHGVAHGDIRADNILVESNGVPCLSDFGFSRIIHSLDKHGYRGKTDVSPAMRWVPPEYIPSIEDDIPYEPTKQGDIWSLGMTIFELWSGRMPYLGISLGGVSKKVRQGAVPKFPDSLRVDLERLREPVSFLCTLCWKRVPAERTTAEELVHVIREFTNGKSISLIKAEIDARNRRPNPSRSNLPQHPPRGGSISSSDTNSTSGSGSIYVGSVRSPYEGSDSGYDTTPDSGPPGKKGVKREDGQDSSVPTWSHVGGAKGKNPIRPGESQPINSAQASQKPKSEGRPGPTGTTPLAPFSAFPPPPPPNSPLGSVNSWMTALLNYKSKHKLTTLIIERSATGEDHQPEFTSVCKIGGREYARCTDFKKKGADEKAAQEALTKLYNENPELATEATPNYLSAFNTYLAVHELQDRIEMEYETTGEDHNPIWTCALYRDGKRLSQGTATTKNKASEEAARKAALNWSDG